MKLNEQHINYAENLALIKSRNLPGGVRANYEDMKSDAYLGLVEAANSYRSDKQTSFTTHAHVRIRGRMDDSVRRQAIRRRSLGEQVLEGDVPQEGEVVRLEYDGLLPKLLAPLKPPAREMMKMFYVDDLDYGEIADRLKISRETVISRIKQYKRELRQRWCGTNLAELC